MYVVCSSVPMAHIFNFACFSYVCVHFFGACHFFSGGIPGDRGHAGVTAVCLVVTELALAVRKRDTSKYHHNITSGPPIEGARLQAVRILALVWSCHKTLGKCL